MKVNLDINQKNAVYIKEKNVLVVASPGSGKTTVIINRVNHLIEDLKINEGNIIVITFTRAAADNMRNRYKSIFKKEKAPFFGTFHGLFYKILLREGYDIKIMDGGKGHAIIKSVLSRYFDDVNDDKVREVMNNISMFKTSLCTIDEFKSTVSKDIFLECLKVYESSKEREGLWDFDDLSVTVLKLFTENKRVLEKYRRMFKYILVDEFQDCDNIQVSFLLLMNKDNELFAVGDEDQCIYSFRGSKPEYMVNFHETFKNGVKVKLLTNYRSKNNIVEVSKRLIDKNENRNEKEIISYCDSHGIVHYSTPYNEYMQGEEIAKYIKENYQGTYADNAVLYRTNMESRSMIDILTKRKIPFVLLDKGYNFFNHFICKDLINYLKLSIDQYDKNAFAWIINKPFRYISKENLGYINSYQEHKSPFDILINKKDMPPFQCKKIDDLRKEILYLNKMSLGSAIQYIISTMGYIDYLREYANKYGQSLDDLEDVLEEFKGAAEGFKTITEFLIHVNNVEEQIESSKAVEDGVILSTIHGVKGMEFNNVYIINCNEEVIPHKSSMEENIEEERRLFYVAITRAINNLYVFSPKTIRGKFRETSRFIAESHLKEEAEKIDYGIEVGNMLYHRTYGEGSVIEIDKDKITIKFKDICRSFSLKVLMENNLVILIN
ncbi:MAG: ATP-dependent helicase [Clostridiales bacterium]|uniref:ATP-dependent helicase n=1 Tax=Clostridia TaxID=186801 RepID=UPI00267260BC|nr:MULTISPECIES: ATP-dependent helicase [Clostridia]MDD7757110.1 ATP-dependent helicase [Clostridiales bacterium]MDD7682236.1 ATP-dependent helicase [Clostridium sp.]MDD7757111.1 ATP-dependent helicase [Clostridiales bacterium]MDY2580261.1 ATP-dependent helicase [Clostridium sp.]MDY4137443.1 ATP-dependent helicase [Terrisporobacter sp.]